MPVRKCPNGKYAIGPHSPCVHDTREAAEAAMRAAYASGMTKEKTMITEAEVLKQAPTADMSNEQLHAAQEARSKKYGIEITDDTSLTFPSGAPESLDEYGDPVNLKFPVDTPARAANARVRFKQFAGNYKETRSQREVHTRIAESELRHGIVPSINEDDKLDMLLPKALRDKAMEAARKSVEKEEGAAPVFKELDLEDIATLNTDDLLKAHDALHYAFRSALTVESANAAALHTAVVERLSSLGVGHPRPPRDSLDHITSSLTPFESDDVDFDPDDIKLNKAIGYYVLPGQDVRIQLREEHEQAFATDLFFSHRHDEAHENRM